MEVSWEIYFFLVLILLFTLRLLFPLKDQNSLFVISRTNQSLPPSALTLQPGSHFEILASWFSLWNSEGQNDADGDCLGFLHISARHFDDTQMTKKYKQKTGWLEIYGWDGSSSGRQTHFWVIMFFVLQLPPVAMKSQRKAQKILGHTVQQRRTKWLR